MNFYWSKFAILFCLLQDVIRICLLYVVRILPTIKRGAKSAWCLGPMSWDQYIYRLVKQCFTEYKNIYTQNLKNIHVHNLQSLSWYRIGAASVSQWEAAPGHATHNSRDGAENINYYLHNLDWSEYVWQPRYQNMSRAAFSGCDATSAIESSFLSIGWPSCINN